MAGKMGCMSKLFPLLSMAPLTKVPLFPRSFVLAFQPLPSVTHRRICSPGLHSRFSPTHNQPFSPSNLLHNIDSVDLLSPSKCRTRGYICRSHEEGIDEPFSFTQLDGDSNDKAIDFSNRDFSHVLKTIELAAYQAGKLALETAGKIAVKSTKTNVRDLVTESDVECQRIIREIISKEFPEDVFLGEEDVDLSGGGDDASSDALRRALGVAGGDDSGLEVGDTGCNRLVFIVDPIDGTTNFQAGLPMYAMSIGVVTLVGGKPEVVAGVIYNPALGEITSAVRGRGCYLNNKRIIPKTNPISDEKQSAKPILLQSLINIGFPVAKESTLLASSRAVAALATKVRGLRMIASASQVMAWVAQSKLQAYVSWDLNAWDVAAGVVIVEESGGLVSNFDGTKADISSRDMIITCPPENEKIGQLKDELIQVLKDNNCLEY